MISIIASCARGYGDKEFNCVSDKKWANQRGVLKVVDAGEAGASRGFDGRHLLAPIVHLPETRRQITLHSIGTQAYE